MDWKNRTRSYVKSRALMESATGKDKRKKRRIRGLTGKQAVKLIKSNWRYLREEVWGRG